MEKLEKSGVATREEGGALVVHFPEETKLAESMIFQKTDGATLYQTRDFAKSDSFISHRGF
jgi:arginyl-tRNA synthetase